jgi:type I restriction enzyme S subunit
MSTDKNKLIPELRFPEFLGDGGWEEKELGVCLSQKPEYGINAAAVPYSKKLPKYLRITDISENGVYLENGKVSVDRDVSEDNYLSTGDIVLARTGASVGKSYKYRHMDGRLVFAGFLIRVKPDIKKLDSELLFQFLSTSQYWKWVSFISARSGQPGINGTEYSIMPICLPLNINEQQKIASCLSSLDEVIAVHSQKLATLKDHKKGLMQNLFPTNSITNDELEITNVPNYRFPEFLEDGGWVEKKLGDKEVSYFVNEKTSVDKLNVNSYVSTENMLPEFSGVSTSSKLPSLGNFTKFKNGDILISNIRPYLKKVWKADKIGGASNDVLVFRYGSEVLSEFLECIIKNEAFINYVMEGAKGVKMPRGDKDYMQKYIVFIPSKMEQQKIASCLSSLDDLITAQTEKIAQLKLHKKGLMQGLFPRSITN